MATYYTKNTIDLFPESNFSPISKDLTSLRVIDRSQSQQLIRSENQNSTKNISKQSRFGESEQLIYNSAQYKLNADHLQKQNGKQINKKQIDTKNENNKEDNQNNGIYINQLKDINYDQLKQQDSPINYYQNIKLNSKKEKSKQVGQPFIPYKYRQDFDSSNVSQHNNISDGIDQINYDSNEVTLNEIIKEEYRDPILNVEKHKKDFGINIAQKMNRFQNIKALTSKNQQLQVAFDNANNLFIVDQRDDNYLPNTIMNQNLELSQRKQNSEHILQSIIQNQQNQINMSDGLSSSIITNGRESMLSQIAKRSQFKQQLANSNRSSQLTTKQNFYTNKQQPLSINSPKNMQSPTNALIYTPANYTNKRKITFQMGSTQGSNLFSQSQRSSYNPQIALDYLKQSQFDKYTVKKPIIPLVGTRMALIKNNNKKRDFILNTEGSYSKSAHYPFREGILKNTGKQSDWTEFKNSQMDTNTQQSQNLKTVKSSMKTTSNFSTQSMSTLNTKQNFFSQTQTSNFLDNNNLVDTLKTWKVNNFNDDFNRIPKNLKKSYYLSQLNKKNHLKLQIAYFTTNGKYGFFSNKTEENEQYKQKDRQPYFQIDEVQEKEQVQEYDQNYPLKNKIAFSNEQNTQEKNINNQSQTNEETDSQNVFQQNNQIESEEKYKHLTELLGKSQNDINNSKINEQQGNNIVQQEVNEKINENCYQPNHTSYNNTNQIQKQETTYKQEQQQKVIKIENKIEKQNNYRKTEQSKGRRSEEYDSIQVEELTERQKSKTLHSNTKNQTSQTQYDKQKYSYFSQELISYDNKYKQKHTTHPNIQISPPIKAQQNLANLQINMKNIYNNDNIHQNVIVQSSSTSQTKRESLKEDIKLSQIIEFGESQDNSYLNMDIDHKDNVIGFHIKDKNDEDEDLENYLNSQNIITSHQEN